MSSDGVSYILMIFRRSLGVGCSIFKRMERFLEQIDVGMLNVMVLFTGLYFYGCFCRKNERNILLCRRRRCCHTSFKLTDVDS